VSRRPIPLDDVGEGDAALVGGKAFVLARLRRLGLPVPDAVVVPAGCTLTTAEVEDVLSRLGGVVAVRSSSTAEDMEEASFAGQYETRLWVAGAQAFSEAIAAVRASAANAEGYARAAGASAGEMAVLVQRMARARAAGVVFTQDPRDASALVLEARAGTGDAVVSGEVTPERYVLDRESGKLRDSPPQGVLDAATLARVVDLARAVESRLGAPQDVEWAVEDGEVALLQARPITVEAETGRDPRIRRITRANVGEVLPDPVSPLTETSVMTFLEHAFCEVASSIRLLPDGAPPFQVLYRRRLYLNLSLCVDVAAGFPGLSPAAAEALVLGRGGAAGATLRAAPSLPRLVGLVRGVLGIARALPRWVAEAEAWERALPSRESLARAGRAELGRLLERFLEDGRTLATTHVAVSGASGVWLALLAELLRRLAPGDPQERVNRLVGGLEDVESVKPTIALEEIAGEASARPAWTEWLRAAGVVDGARASLETAPPELRASLVAFLEHFGHRGVAEGELQAASWRDDPGPVLSALASLVSTPEALGLARRTRSEERRAEEEALLSPTGPLRGAALRRVIQAAQDGVRRRERTKSIVVRLARHGRDLARAAALHLLADGRLEREEDVFLLRMGELRRALDGGPAPGPRVLARRRRRQESEGSLPVPKEVDFTDSKGREEAPTPRGVLRGQGVSAGAAQGRARVLGPGDPWTLAPGEVLVAPVLDAAFGPLLASAAGAVAEVGGMLSHGAVVARELGVPCVVEVKDATRLIRTGDVIVVDGGTGEIALPEEGGAHALHVPSPTLVPEEEEEALHALAEHPLARESVYFNPQDPGTGIGLICSLGVKAGFRGEAVAVLSLPDGRVLFGFATGKPRIDAAGFAVGGMRAEWAPVRLRVEAAMAPFEASAFPASPPSLVLAPRTTRVVIDLVFEPRCPAFDFCRGLGERARAALRPLGDHHLEQSGRWRGLVRVDDRTFPFDGVGHRDHSWGLRDWSALEHHRLFVASLGDDLAVHALTVTAAGQAVEGGFVFRDGRAERITRVLYAARREGSRVTSFDLRVLTADGNPVTLRGTPWRTVSVPIQLDRRLLRHLAGRPYRLLLHESFTRYEGEGCYGHGIAELSERPRIGTLS